MPKKSAKTALIDSICESAFEEIEEMDNIDESETIDAIFENAIDEVSLLLEHRYYNPRGTVIKSKEWWAKILPCCDDKTFKHHLRITRQDFQEVLDIIKGNQLFTKRQLDTEYQLAIALARFGENGTASSWLKIAARFGVGEGTVDVVTKRVIKVLTSLKSEFIVWPDEKERDDICLEMCTKLPKCIGYIDGTHIKLEEAPWDDHESYFSRKQDYAIQMQAVVDNNRRIRDIFIGYPASVHDARVFVNSNIGKHPARYFTNDQWIAGDSAYTLTENLITPFRKNTTEVTEYERKAFQTHFAKYRVKVENAFGILKEVFGSLKELRIRVNRQEGHKAACDWILACCVLYNIVLPDCDVPIPDIDDDEDDFSHIPSIGSADQKRMKLCHWILGQ